MVNKSIFMDSRYSAKDVAIYVLWYCENKLNKAIDNLRLNKLLYLIQAKYLYLYNESIFLNLDEGSKLKIMSQLCQSFGLKLVKYLNFV